METRNFSPRKKKEEKVSDPTADLIRSQIKQVNVVKTGDEDTIVPAAVIRNNIEKGGKTWEKKKKKKKGE